MKTPTSEHQHTEYRHIVTVVFDYNLDTREAVPGAKEYAYFFKGPVKRGDIALVRGAPTPHAPAGRFVGVLATSTEPTADAIRHASKSLVGTVDMSVYDRTRSADTRAASEEAWARYTGEI